VIIKNFLRNEDGSCSFKCEVDDQEAQALIEFAVMQLINMGVIRVEDQGDIEAEIDYFINSGGKLS
jgi:hypothetical protein